MHLVGNDCMKSQTFSVFCDGALITQTVRRRHHALEHDVIDAERPDEMQARFDHPYKLTEPEQDSLLECIQYDPEAEQFQGLNQELYETVEHLTLLLGLAIVHRTEQEMKMLTPQIGLWIMMFAAVLVCATAISGGRIRS